MKPLSLKKVSACVSVIALLAITLQCNENSSGPDVKDGKDSSNKPVDSPRVAGLNLLPPFAKEIFIQKLKKPDKDGNNIRLTVRFASDKRLSSLPELSIHLDSNKLVTLHDDGRLGDEKPRDGEYNMLMRVDEVQLMNLLNESNRQIRNKKNVETIFVERSATLRPLPFLDILKFREGIRIPLEIPFTSIISKETLPPITTKSLMVTDLLVVGDPARTFDPCGTPPVGNPDGAWSFKTLITKMVNGQKTPLEFLTSWVDKQLFSVQTLPGSPDATTDRQLSKRRLIRSWILNSHNSIPTDKDLTGWESLVTVEGFPVRLTAIINRIDLRDNDGYTGAASSFGEGRFVFTFADAIQGCSAGFNQEGTMTFILEYAVPLAGCFERWNYAKKWWNLRETAFGETFNSNLETITNIFTAANVMPERPNGSALNHLRVNDFLPLEPNSQTLPWDLRQFEIDADLHVLKLTAPNREPMRKANGSIRLPDSQADIASLVNFVNGLSFPFPQNPVYEIPPGLQGSHGPMPVGPLPENPYFWSGNPPDVMTPENRREFSFNTCTGCHKGETRNQFTHVRPRQAMMPAELSGFMTGTGDDDDPDDNADDNNPMGNILVKDVGRDPLSEPKRFNEALRRGQDLETAIFGSACMVETRFPPDLMALMRILRFMPLNMSH